MDHQVIWFTGFYEGEGSVSNDIGNRNKIRVSISQNDRTPLDIGKDRWGGYIRKRTRVTPTGKVCHGHEWIMNHSNAVKFLCEIKPFMIIPRKIQQVDECLAKSSLPWTRTFTCHFCTDVFKDASGRRRHELNQHIQKGVMFKCDFCDNRYASRDSMKRHIRLNHSSVVSRESGDTSYNDGKLLRAQTTTEEVKAS